MARRELRFLNTRTLLDAMIQMGVARSGEMACNTIDAVKMVLPVVDRKKGAEADGDCDPCSMW